MPDVCNMGVTGNDQYKITKLRTFSSECEVQLPYFLECLPRLQ